jgi:hypothetical protein
MNSHVWAVSDRGAGLEDSSRVLGVEQADQRTLIVQLCASVLNVAQEVVDTTVAAHVLVSPSGLLEVDVLAGSNCDSVTGLIRRAIGRVGGIQEAVYVSG